MSIVRCPACNVYIIAPPDDGCTSRAVHAAAAEAVLDGFEMGKRRVESAQRERHFALGHAVADLLAYAPGTGAGTAFRRAFKQLRDVMLTTGKP